MRFLRLVLASLLVVAPAAADCPENPASIEMANEGDKIRAINLDGAIEKYQHAHQLAPGNHRILWKLATAYMKKENWDEVDHTLEKAIAIAPKNAAYVAGRGIAQAHQSQWAEAKATLEHALALDPNRGEAHYQLAEAAIRLGDEKTALVHYTKAIENAPDDAVAYAALADLYLRLGFDEQAERTITTGEARVTDEGKKFVLYTLHGSLLAGRKDLVLALAKYEAAKKSCGQCSERGQHVAFFNLGSAYAALTPPRKAEAMVNLSAFYKMICKGPISVRYANECVETQMLMSKLGGSP